MLCGNLRPYCTVIPGKRSATRDPHDERSMDSGSGAGMTWLAVMT